MGKDAIVPRITKEVLLVNNGTFGDRKATLGSRINLADGDTAKDMRGSRNNASNHPTAILKRFCFQEQHSRLYAPLIHGADTTFCHPHVSKTAHTSCALHSHRAISVLCVVDPDGRNSPFKSSSTPDCPSLMHSALCLNETGLVTHGPWSREAPLGSSCE